MSQNQVSIMNPESAALLADFRDQLRQFNTDVTNPASRFSYSRPIN